MRKVLAIAGIAIRNAMRSRIVLVLLALLLIAIVALPLTIKGDGTLTGKVQVMLRYSLGAVTIILSIATWWAGCAAISTEIQEHQVQLIVTKPVRRAQLWLGKWLGLFILNAVLLAVAGAVTYGLLRWNLQSSKLSTAEQKKLQEEILVARRVVAPVPIDLTEDVQKIFEEQQRRGELPSGARPDQALEAIRQTLLRQIYSAAPSMAVAWTFKLPHLPVTGHPLVVRYQFATSQTDKEPVACVWVAGPPHRTDRFQLEEWSAPGGVHTIQIPTSMIETDQTLTVMAGNAHPVPLTMVFSPSDGVHLLVYESSFEANFARSLLIILWQLAFLGALSVTMGSVFSLPVAALVAGAFVMLTNIGGYLKTLATETVFFANSTPDPSVALGLLDRLLHPVYVGLYWLALPFQSPNPLELLAIGELVSWTWVLVALWWKVAVITGLLAAIGIWIFDRRELGLPA